jgi:hypothetical protein
MSARPAKWQRVSAKVRRANLFVLDLDPVRGEVHIDPTEDADNIARALRYVAWTLERGTEGTV